MITLQRGLQSLVVLALLLGTGDVWGQPGRGRGGPGGGFPGFGGFGGGFRGFGEPDSLLSNLRRDGLASELGLTESQQEQLNSIADELRNARGEFMRERFNQPRDPNQTDEQRREQFRKDMAEFSKPYEQRAIKLLNDQQKATWEVKKAEFVKEAAEREAERQASGNNGPPSRGPTPGGSPQPPQRPRTIVLDPPPEGAVAEASFGVMAPGEGGARGVGPDALISFNFRHAPWTEVLKLFAETAGLTLDLTAVPPDTFNYYDDHRYTVTEALDVLNGYLLPKGYLLIRRDRFLACINVDDGILPSMVPDITASELPHRGKYEMVRLVIPVQGSDADRIDGEIQVLLGPQGTVTAMRNTNSLVVTDIASNVRRVYELLQGGIEKDSDHDYKAIPLKYISAADAERQVRRHFGLNPAMSLSSTQPTFGGFYPGGFGPGGFGGPGFDPRFGGGPGFGGPGGDPRYSSSGSSDRDRSSSGSSRSSSSAAQQSPYAGKIQVTADTRTNSLLVTASSQLVRLVEDVVRTMDTNRRPDGTLIEDSTSPVVLKVYNVSGGDATQIATTLGYMMPTVLIIPDARNARLHIQATEDEHREVATLVKQFTGDAGNSVMVIALQKLDPIAATNTIRNLFVNEGTRAPTIEADAQGRKLMVRGTPDQVAQVRTLLAQLGEPGDSGQPASSGGPVRRIPLAGRDLEEFLPMLKQTWEGTYKSPIRIVVPSAPSSPIRNRKVPSQSSLLEEPPPSTQTLPATPAVPLAQEKAIVRDLIDNSVAAPTRSLITRSTTTGRRLPAVSVVAEESLPEPESFAPRSAARVVPPPAEPAPTTRTDDDAAFNAFLESFCDPVDTQTSGDNASDEETDAQNDEDTGEAIDQSAPAEAAASQKPIGLTVVGDELIITGGDDATRDEMEALIAELAAIIPARTRWTMFYLRSADATETAQMLERLFPQSTVTASTGSSDGILGSLSSGLSSFGRGLMNTTGLSNYTLGGQQLRIITEPRMNALFVSGPSDKIAEVEAMLQVLDGTDMPQSLRERLPRTIAVEYADIDEVAEIVQNVYKDAINPEQNQGSRGGFNPLAMLMGQQGGGGQGARPRGPELTVGIDYRSSHLIVSCNDTLFRQIEDMVKLIDQRARDAKHTVRVVPLATADPALVSTTLASLIPKVSVSSTRSSRPRPGQPGAESSEGNQTRSSSSSSSGYRPSFGGGDSDLMRRIIEQRMQQQGGGPSGSPFGGDRGGSDRGGSDRGSFFRFGGPGGFGGGFGGDRGRDGR